MPRFVPAGAFALAVGLVASPGAARTVVAPRTVAAPVHFVVASTGNTVRYRVRERLVGHDLDNDAIGETSNVTGEITVGADGKFVPASSRIVVDVTGLKSDRDMRDRYVQRRLLETDSNKTVTFVPTGVRGIALPLPTSGTRAFDLTGNLTVKGVTRPATWHVNATFAPSGMQGQANTTFTFSDYSINQPRVPVLLSVADTIKLEYDFNLTAQK